MITALVTLIALQLAGEIIVSVFMLPIPGAVVGLVLLYFGLVVHGELPESLRATTGTLLQHLMLFLVPATTGLILHLRRLGDEWLPILLAGIVGTAITMTATAVTLRIASKAPRVR